MRSYSNPITVSGNPATFTAQNAKVLSLSVPIVLTQDLHGYSYPWPAGGGKNKFNTNFTDGTENGIDFTKQADGKILANGTLSSALDKLVGHVTLPAGTYILNGTPAGGSSSTYGLQVTDYPVVNNLGIEYGSGVSFTLSQETEVAVRVRFRTNNAQYSNILFAPMIRVSSESNAEFAPYSNICPITGRTGLTVYVGPDNDPDNATTYTSDWTSPAGTVYSGSLNLVTGVLTVDRANIASYNGETITEPWLSSMDAYAAGTTPTTGAQVVYTLATPVTYQLTPHEVELINGLNNVWGDANTTITLSYALLYFVRQKLIVNGTDLSEYVERDSYRTSLTPVYGQTIETLNGVQHTALLRLRGALKVGLNPQTDTDTATICTALLNTPCQVTYHCLQRDADVTSLMKVDPISAQFLSRCLFLGDEWNDIDDITLTEL